MLLQIALTLRCDTTRVCGLQSGCREYDDTYNTNHLLMFQWNPTHDDQINTPWMAVNPPAVYSNLDKPSIEDLPLDRYQNIKFYSLLASGPRKPSHNKHAIEYDKVLKAANNTPGTLADTQ